MFTPVRLYYLYKATPEFQRRISYVIDCNGQTVQYAVVQYLLDGGQEAPVILPPHGNVKKDTSSHRRTQKNNFSQIKEASEKPKSEYLYLHNEAGGMLEATNTSELPRNRRQVYIQHFTLIIITTYS